VKLLLLALALSTLTACASLSSGNEEDDFRVPRVCEPQIEQLPCGAGVAQGVTYRFELLTHCGIEWAYFDGRYWVPRPKVDVPSHWANIEPGTMVLERRGEAIFEADKGGGARFVPAASSFRPSACA
jgi:hypothetical protein